MKNVIEVFKPGIAELTELADKYKSLSIGGVDDKDGYDEVYNALQDLKKARVGITKFGKSKREEANAYLKEVLRQEKELLLVIGPVEGRLKEERSRIDELKKIEERKILLPGRKKLLQDIGIGLRDSDILEMDEKQFSTYYTEKQLEHNENQERRKIQQKEKEDAEEEARKQRLAQIGVEKENERLRLKVIEQTRERTKKAREEEIEKQKREVILEKEREASQKIVDKLAEAQERENARVEEARKEEEEKAKEIEEVKFATDKQKLEKLLTSILQIQIPEVKSGTAQEVLAFVREHLAEVGSHILSAITTSDDIQEKLDEQVEDEIEDIQLSKKE